MNKFLSNITESGSLALGADFVASFSALGYSLEPTSCRALVQRAISDPLSKEETAASRLAILEDLLQSCHLSSLSLDSLADKIIDLAAALSATDSGDYTRATRIVAHCLGMQQDCFTFFSPFFFHRAAKCQILAAA